MEDYLQKLMLWLSKWFKTKEYADQLEFSSHFFGHAFFTFMLLSLPVIGSYVGVIPVIIALYFEMIRDKHYKNLFSSSDDAKDGRTDLLARGIGSLIPYIVLLWR